jgi:hypothetical protein
VRIGIRVADMVVEVVELTSRILRGLITFAPPVDCDS